MIPNTLGSGRALYRKVQPLIQDVTNDGQGDRYRKHFRIVSHIWVLILHIAHGGHSLRHSYARLGADKSLLTRLNMPCWVSFSQLARSSTTRQSDCFERLLAALTNQVRRTPGLRKDQDWHALSKAIAIDSTFLKLSAKLSPWSKRGNHPAGVRAQWSLELASHIPQLLHMHTVEKNDHDTLRALVEQNPHQFVGWTVIIDLGYYGHRQFEQLLACGGHIVSKLNAQASYRVTEEREVSQREGWTHQHDRVVSDQTITLGSPNNRRGAVLSGIRLVSSCNIDGQLCSLITDRFDLEAWEVVALYRKRWQIELFFRWLKRQLGAIRPLGHSREAVWLTMLMAGIVALIWLWLDEIAAHPPGMSRICWLGAVSVAIQSVLNLSG
jgi:Transposase DDE domain